MTTQEIANRLVELCRTGQNAQAYKELFAENAVAVEPAYTQAPNTEGLPALIAKAEGFGASIAEMRESTVSEPLVAGNYISLSMGMDVSFKDGRDSKMEEVCVYQVQDGKIVREEFFY